MKRVYVIGGTMGVGKTTVSEKLLELLPDSVFLDGDWCWRSNPFQVTDETKAMVIGNIAHMLNSFIGCSAYKNVIFCWVMHRQEIIDDILSRLELGMCEVLLISLTASPEALRRRIENDISAGIRSEDVLARSLERLPFYEDLNTLKLDVSTITAEEAAGMIAEL